MLKLKHQNDYVVLAKQALRNWDYDTETLDDTIGDFSISSYVAYPFHEEEKPCRLHLAFAEDEVLTDLEGEIELIRYLRRRGFPAWGPIKSCGGDYVLSLSAKCGKFYATAFYDAAGVPLRKSGLSDAICFAYGKTLGRFHKLSAGYEPKVKIRTHENYLNEMEALFLKLCPEDAVKDRAAELRRELSALPNDSLYYGLVHFDFTVDNVYYDEKHEVCRVTDFDDSMYHFYALDIERALSSLQRAMKEDEYASAKMAFLMGYKTEFIYDEIVRDAMPLMRSFCELYEYASLVKELSARKKRDPEWKQEKYEAMSRRAEALRALLMQEK